MLKRPSLIAGSIAIPQSSRCRRASASVVSTNKTPQRSARLAPEHNVLGDAKLRQEAHLLMYKDYTPGARLRWRCETVLFSGDRYRS